MSAPKFNSKSPTIRRILREAQELSAAPSSDYTATPLETDLFEWHFTLRGPPNSAYAEGLYHGRIVLPPTYPLRPPSFRFLTPSGRFEANREICLSISGHHEETWQPAWGVRTALVALRSFMETDAKGQLGGLDMPDAVRRRMATESKGFRCNGCGGRTNEDIMRECEEAANAAAEEAAAAGSNSGLPKEVEVPADLKMGFRDEMEKAAAAAAAAAAASGNKATVPPSGSSIGAVAPADDDSESAELAEGFVQTVPRTQVDVSAGAARPGQTVPQPTRTVPLPNGTNPNGLTGAQDAQRAPLLQQQQQRQPLQDDGVPRWVDRVIVALVVCLVGMILKVMLGN